MKTKLKVETIKLAEIKPYRMNAKKHPPEQIEQIAKSIEEFGFNDPIAIWGEENVIVEGHGRYLAAKKMGMTEVPVVRLDHLNDEQRRAYTLVHNQLTLNSGFDLETLNFEIDAIKSFDLGEYGFTMPEQDLDGGGEIDASDFADEEFECECPRCGFRFNPKKEKS